MEERKIHIFHSLCLYLLNTGEFVIDKIDSSYEIIFKEDMK